MSGTSNNVEIIIDPENVSIKAVINQHSQGTRSDNN